MEENIRDYARLGLVHHMLYPDSVDNPECHAATLAEFLKREDIETLDCCVPYDLEKRKTLVPLLRKCGKEVVYALHLFPLRKVSFASCCPQEQGVARLVVRDQIEAAREAGATALIFASGPGGPPENLRKARAAFRAFCGWLCRELHSCGMTALLEPFDADVDKKFLYGPVSECVELVESLLPDVSNLGLEIDVAHLPLMREGFEDAVKTAAPYLKRIHLGNCVLKDTKSPFYGDMHPPIGLEGGEVGVPELVRVLRALLEVGYLSRRNRGALVLEMRPFPGETADFTVADNIKRLEQAWRLV